MHKNQPNINSPRPSTDSSTIKEQEHTRYSAMINIEGVESRIQDKANVLFTKRAKLKVKQAQLNDSRNKQNEEMTVNDNIRKILLSIVRSKNDVEFKLLHQKDVVKELERTTDELERVTTVHIREEIGTLRKTMRHTLDTIYAPHDTKTDIYRHRIESKLQRKKMRRQKREAMLDKLALNADRYREEATSKHSKRKRLHDEILKLEKLGKKEDEEIAAVAMQIRATLQKRKSLRIALEDATERNKKAHESMLG